MNSFRWAFGLLTAVLLAGWVFLVVVGGNFRRSFGASPGAPLLPLLPGLLLGLVLATLLWPGQRPLLHVTAVAAVLGLLATLAILRESAATAAFVAAYLACWLVFYWHALRRLATDG